ncbi:MAG: hypothetical protein JNM99_22225 [Verrucomicrobiaceae bacterium]|nr:hypothetical protein [Verrucomicrobiaceae bacterium]
MITIRFKTRALKDKAVACLTGNALVKDWHNGALSLPEALLEKLKERGIPFITQGIEPVPSSNEADSPALLAASVSASSS